MLSKGEEPRDQRRAHETRRAPKTARPKKKGRAVARPFPS